MTPGEILRGWFTEIWNERKFDRMAHYVTEDALFHTVAETGGEIRGPAGFLPFIQRFTDAFPDIEFRIDRVIEDGDIGAIRWTAEMTHRGDALGPKATNRPVRITGMAFVRVVDGKCVETWDEWDRLSLFRQIDGITFTQA